MMVETVVSLRDGHETFFASVRTCCTNCAGDVLAIVGVTPLSNALFHDPEKIGRRGGTRTPDTRFWRPMLYQLSYTPTRHQKVEKLIFFLTKSRPGGGVCGRVIAARTSKIKHSIVQNLKNYSMIFATTPAPTVRPPSRIAKRRPSSIAIGAMRVAVIWTLSPGITISVPAGSSIEPVTSVVRK